MTLPFNPEVWNSVGVVGFLIVTAGIVFWGLKQGWLILGIHHREIVSAKDETIAELREGRRNDGQTIQQLTTTVSEWDVAGKLQTHILDSLRESAGRGQS
ncbi:hypothetical protein SEA_BENTHERDUNTHAT_25 [Gordonia phage BENtherdunthat]|uniref:Uncharacterized protein n=3 Tax=Getalongvirus TaxID=2733156 RepID=A0A3S9UPT1_9CAUD|nr:hypothetical protein HOS44_gp025 [Gordonia phage BENtherdunthat]YP_009818640.1 hypothetical protein HOU97_gp24 [Gordonia phage Kenna]QCG77182.1 hypothetical protein SEA_LUTUM_25 [Gordonia phage Lutum]QHJ86361.1 hypothetical protein SEA_KUWABARA_24 [Gordonia phage Kuwabara]USH45519.1 membrane protein [Gordonia phage Phabuloso]UTN91482.1 membrane protein [Gordonia phage Periwinkle]WNM74426.1 membrane protein [Gordonia phage BearBQ]